MRDRLVSRLSEAGSVVGNFIGNSEKEAESADETELCKKVVPTDDLPKDKGGWCCLRPVWEGENQCFWHADRAGKENTDSDAVTRDRSPMLTAKKDRIRLDQANLRSAKFTKAENTRPMILSFNFEGDSLIGADLKYSKFEDCRFHNTDLRNVEAREANFDGVPFDKSNLSNSNFYRASCEGSSFWQVKAESLSAPEITLTDANLHQTILNESRLTRSTFEDAKCHKTSFQGANLEDSNLERCELEGADLTDARLYGAEVRFTSIDETTELGDRCIYEKEADSEVLPKDERGSFLLAKPKMAWRYFDSSPEETDEPSKLRKASRVYRMYQRLLRENDLPGEISHYRVREREVRRKMALQENNLRKWFTQSVQRWSMNYGESPAPVIRLSVGLILVCMLLFPLWGVDSGNTVIEYGSSRGILWTLGKSFYFSAVTFTTLGYGDLQPVGWSQLLATVETFVGSLLMALLVFVLGQRASW